MSLYNMMFASAFPLFCFLRHYSLPLYTCCLDSGNDLTCLDFAAQMNSSSWHIKRIGGVLCPHSTESRASVLNWITCLCIKDCFDREEDLEFNRLRTYWNREAWLHQS